MLVSWRLLHLVIFPYGVACSHEDGKCACALDALKADPSVVRFCMDVLFFLSSNTIICERRSCRRKVNALMTGAIVAQTRCCVSNIIGIGDDGYGQAAGFARCVRGCSLHTCSRAAKWPLWCRSVSAGAGWAALSTLHASFCAIKLVLIEFDEFMFSI